MSLVLRKRSACLLGTLLALVILAGCGSNLPATGTQQASLSNIPIGKGSDPEPGTNGKPQPTPEGHSESIVTANNVTYVGSDNGQVYAFDARSGRLIWHRQESATYLRGSIGNELYASDARTDNGNSIYALNAQTGAQLWQYAENEPDMVSVGDGRVYTSSMQQDMPGTSSGPQLITALDASSGRVLWRLTTKNNESIERGGIAEANGVAYLAATSGSVYAVQAVSGQPIWYTHQSSDPMGMKAISAATPVISNGVVYAGSTTGVFAYRTSDGSQVWEHTTDNGTGPPGPGSPEVVGNGIISIGEANGTVRVFRLSDGAQLWQYKIQELPMQSPPVYSALVTFTKSTSYDRAVQISAISA